MQLYIDSIRAYMASRPELVWVHSDYDDIASQSRIVLKADEASRLGVTQASLSLYLASVTRGVTITNIYEHGNTSPTPVVLRSTLNDQPSTLNSQTLKPSNSQTLKLSTLNAQLPPRPHRHRHLGASASSGRYRSCLASRLYRAPQRRAYHHYRCRPCGCHLAGRSRAYGQQVARRFPSAAPDGCSCYPFRWTE